MHTAVVVNTSFNRFDDSRLVLNHGTSGFKMRTAHLAKTVCVRSHITNVSSKDKSHPQGMFRYVPSVVIKKSGQAVDKVVKSMLTDMFSKDRFTVTSAKAVPRNSVTDSPMYSI